MKSRSCALLLIPAACVLIAAPQALGEPSPAGIYAGYAAAKGNGALPKLAPFTAQFTAQFTGGGDPLKADWQGVFLELFPQEASRLQKFNSVRAVAWARGNFDFDPEREVLVNLILMQGVGSYSDVELPIAPAYQIVFVADLDGRSIRRDSVVPVVLNVTRDTDIDCGNCSGLQTAFALIATQDYNKDGTLEVVLQKETLFRSNTGVLDETHLYARLSKGWVPIRQEAPVQSEREPSE